MGGQGRVHGWGVAGRGWRGTGVGDKRLESYSSYCRRRMSNNDERKSCTVTTVSIKDSERYIDMDGIQWRQRQAYSVYKCIQHLR